MSSPRWPLFNCSGASLLRLPCCNGLVHTVMDAEDLRQPGDPEDLEYALLRAHQVQRAIVGTHTLEAADEHAQAGGVKELHLLHVHHELVMAVVDKVNEKLTQPRGGIDVDLALDVDNLNPVRRVMLQFQVHKSSRIMRSLLFSRHALTCRHRCPSLQGAGAPSRIEPRTDVMSTRVHASRHPAYGQRARIDTGVRASAPWPRHRPRSTS